MNFELKSIAAEVKDVDTEKRTVQVYISAFGNVDSHGDIMQKGAYAKTISEGAGRVKHLFNHNASELPVGVVKGLEEDEHGLLMTSELLKTTKGNDLLICYQAGAVNEHSVGFYTMQKKSNQAGNRIITEAKLLEGSTVLWGSNEKTPLVGFKSQDPLAQLAELNKRSEKLYKLLTKGNLTDETCEHLALEHVLITKAMDELIAALRVVEPVGSDAPASPKTTQPDEEPQPQAKTIDLLEAFRQAYRG